MKTPRIAAVVADMKAERDILVSAADQTPEQRILRINMLSECIARLESPKGTYNIKSDTVTKRTRKAKSDGNVPAVAAGEKEPSL